MLIIGGSAHGFAAPATAFACARQAGIGTARVVLPDKLKSVVGRALEARFAPTTPSGSFSRQSLGIILEEADWAQAILLAGDFGRNSETAIVLEALANNCAGRLSVSGDGLDYFLSGKSRLLERRETLLVINLGKLQKLAKNNRPSTPVLHSMNLQEVAALMADWTSSVSAGFITLHAGQILVAREGEVSTTPIDGKPNWQSELPSYASVWWLQQPDKPFEALTSAVYNYSGD